MSTRTTEALKFFPLTLKSQSQRAARSIICHPFHRQALQEQTHTLTIYTGTRLYRTHSNLRLITLSHASAWASNTVDSAYTSVEYHLQIYKEPDIAAIKIRSEILCSVKLQMLLPKVANNGHLEPPFITNKTLVYHFPNLNQFLL